VTAPTSIPTLAADVLAALPWLTVAQMIEVDRAMVDDYGIVLLQMMEHDAPLVVDVAAVHHEPPDEGTAGPCGEEVEARGGC